MSANIEERIVQMQFDNAAFESRAQNTIATLSALDEALQFTSATRGFGSVEDAANRINFEKLNSALDLVNYRFSTIGIIAENVLNKITDKAVETGKALVNALFIQGAKDGFHEYELLMDSTKQILNSAKNEDGTAVNLTQVKDALNELNEYADKTIYNFHDMTSNIGKFTNKGIDLDRSVKAIQGVANVAALAGAKSAQASSAMEAFAKAIGQTYMTQRYWFSITAAQMDNTTFKDELIRTAIELETLKKEGEEYQILTTNNQGKYADAMSKEELFLRGLAYQWMSADVMVDTLGRFTDEEEEIGKKAIQAATEVGTFSKMMETIQEAIGTGWADTWQLVFGDYEESKSFWTRVSEAITEVVSTQTKARNKLVEDWNVLGGRKAVIDGLFNAWQALLNIATPIKDAFVEIFPPITGWELTSLSVKFREFTEQLIIGEDAMNSVKETFRGIFSVFDLAGQIISAVWRAFGEPLTELVKLDMKLDWLRNGAIGKMVADFAANAKETDLFYNALIKLKEPFGFLGGLIETAKTKLEEFLGFELHIPTIEELSNAIQNLKNRFKPLTDALSSASEAIQNFFANIKTSEAFANFTNGLMSFAQGVWKVVKTIGEALLKSIGGVFRTLGNFFKKSGELDFNTLLDGFNAGSLAVLAASLKRILDSLEDPLETMSDLFSDIKKIPEIAEKVGKSFGKFIENLTGPLKALQATLRADVLIKIALAIIIMAGALLMISSIESDKLAGAVVSMLFMVEGLKGLFVAFDALSKAADTKSFFALSVAALILSIAVVAMAKAMKTLGSMEPERLWNAFAAVNLTALIMALIGKIDSKGINTQGLIAMSVAVLILSKAIKGLCEIEDSEKMGAAVLAVGALMVLMGMISELPKGSFDAQGFISLAAAIFIMQFAIKNLGGMEMEDLEKGTAVVGGLIALMAAISTWDTQKFSGIGFVSMAAAILILYVAIKQIGALDEKEVSQGFGIVFSLMIIMGAMSKFADHDVSGAPFIAMAVSILILKGVIKDLSELGKWDLAAAVIAIGSLLFLMTLFSNVGMGDNNLMLAASMAAMAIALRLIVPALTALADIPFLKLVGGLGALLALFTVLFIAGAALEPVVPVLLQLAGAILLLGLGITALGVGLIAAGAGLVSFSVGLAASVASIIASIGEILVGVIGVLSLVAIAVVKGIAEIVRALADNGAVILEAIVTILIAALDQIKRLFPKLAEVLLELTLFVIVTLAAYAPLLANALVELTIQLIDGVAGAIITNSDRIVAAFLHICNSLLDVLLAFIQQILGEIPGVGGKISSEIQKVRDHIAEDFNADKARQEGADVMQGYADGITSKTDAMSAAGSAAGEAGTTGLLDSLSGINPDIMKIFGDEIPSSISGTTGEGEAAAGSYSETIMNALSDKMLDSSMIGQYLDEGIANGILENQGIPTDAGFEMGDDLMASINESLGVSSPSTKTYETGYYMDEGLANGITENQDMVSESAISMGALALAALGEMPGAIRDVGAEGALQFAAGLGTPSHAISAIANVCTTAISRAAEKRSEFRKAGAESGASYSGGISDQSMLSHHSGSLIASSTVVGIGTVKPAFNGAGMSSGGSYATGVSSKAGESRASGVKIGSSAVTGIKSVKGFYGAGQDSGQGYIDGLLSKARDMASAAARVVRDALQAAKDAIHSSSPSRDYRKLGADSDEGYILGVKSKAGEMNATMDQLATNAMGAFYDGLNRANELANDEYLTSPVITPVMDIGGVQDDVDFLSGIFGNTGNILGSISMEIDGNIESINELVYNTKQILSSLNGRKPITIDGKTVIGWVDMELGAL